MAAAVAQRVRQPSAPDRIERDLAGLWRQLAARGAAVSRAIVSNLVVYCDCPEGAPRDLTTPPAHVPIDAVVARHPSRVLLLHHDARTAEPRGPLEAHVEVVIFGGPHAYGVEQIAVRSACGEPSLPSIVRGLVLGDLPTAVWWTEDFAERPPLLSLVGMARQVVYDSRRWQDVRGAVLALAPLLGDPHAPSLADINWRRITPLQRAVHHAGGALGSSIAAGGDILVRHQPEERALAMLAAGWLTPVGAVTLEEAPAIEGLLTVSFGSGVMMVYEGASVRVVENGRTSLTIRAPRETEADAIVAELQSLTRHGSLATALRALLQRFMQAEPRQASGRS